MEDRIYDLLKAIKSKVNDLLWGYEESEVPRRSDIPIEYQGMVMKRAQTIVNGSMFVLERGVKGPPTISVRIGDSTIAAGGSITEDKEIDLFNEIMDDIKERSISQLPEILEMAIGVLDGETN